MKRGRPKKEKNENEKSSSCTITKYTGEVLKNAKNGRGFQTKSLFILYMLGKLYPSAFDQTVYKPSAEEQNFLKEFCKNKMIHSVLIFYFSASNLFENKSRNL